jgi:hypothetical protein
MLLPHVAIIADTDAVSWTALTGLSAALQKQVTRDFGPLWGLQATVDAFANQNDVPLDYWHVVIRDDIDNPTALGFHKTLNNQPFALVQFDDDDWTTNTSHEVLEMLADPSGDRLVASRSVKSDQGRVQYAVEVCDPLQTSSYTVNGVKVCDFYTPHYFDPVAAAGVRYSFTGAISEPRQVIRGGYLSFLDPISGRWWQQRWFDGPSPVIVSVEQAGNRSIRIERPGESLRESIDRVTPSERKSNLARRSSRKRQRAKKSAEWPSDSFESVAHAVRRILSDHGD